MQEMLLYWICFHIQHVPFFGVQVLKSARYNKKTKLCIYQSCVPSTLPYSSECWWITKAKLKRLLVFHRTCLWRISCIFWPRAISNQELMEQCQLEDMKNRLIKRQWRWIWHVLEENLIVLQEGPSTGHQREREREADLKQLGSEQSKRRWSHTPDVGVNTGAGWGRGAWVVSKWVTE